MRIPLVLAAALLMTSPSALAVHGQAYDAYGVAVLGDEVYDAHVYWSGYHWGGGSACSQCFTVTIRDLDGTVLVRDQFPGVWQANGPVFFVGEVLLYHAWAAPSAGGSAHFDLKGVQAQQVYNPAPDKALMVYVGNYQAYALTLVVPFGLL